MEDDHYVDIGIWKCIAPGLGSEQEHVSQAEAIDSLQTLPKFSQICSSVGAMIKPLQSPTGVGRSPALFSLHPDRNEQRRILLRLVHPVGVANGYANVAVA